MKGSIVKRGPKSWSAVVYIGKDPTTGKDRQKWYTHKTEGEAEAHLTTLLAQLNGGGTIPDTKLRLGEFLDQWLEKYAVGAVGPTTLRSYQDTIKKHLKPKLGSVPLVRLSPITIQEYFSEKLKETRSKKNKEGLSPSTLQRHAMILHEALSHAVKWGYLVRNPADMVDPPARNQTEMKVWDEKQVQSFLEKAKASPYSRLYLAAITTGRRQGELLGL
jgi:integrase